MGRGTRAAISCLAFDSLGYLLEAACEAVEGGRQLIDGAHAGPITPSANERPGSVSFAHPGMDSGHRYAGDRGVETAS